jgi:pimeloyl-ACP methyl ester carboxylesterase
MTDETGKVAEERLTAAHGMLTAARSGRGRDLVILHSLLTDRHAFDPVVPALAAKFRVTLFNLPGFHGSEPVPALMEAYLARIEDGFDEFRIEPDCILIGNGFGGTLALGFALAHPDRLGKLVIVDAAPAFPEEGKQALRAMAQRIDEGGPDAIADDAVKRIFSPAYLARHPNAVSTCRATLRGIDANAFRAACEVLVDADLVPLLPRLKVSTLVVCGALDQATPPALNRIVAEKAAAAHFVEISGCGHCPPLEQPEAFLRAIKDFIGL